MLATSSMRLAVLWKLRTIAPLMATTFGDNGENTGSRNQLMVVMAANASPWLTIIIINMSNNCYPQSLLIFGENKSNYYLGMGYENSYEGIFPRFSLRYIKNTIYRQQYLRSVKTASLTRYFQNSPEFYREFRAMSHKNFRAK